MGFRKIEADGYILGVARTDKGNITEAEYNEISQIIRTMPVPPDGYRYRLTSALKWELYELPWGEMM